MKQFLLIFLSTQGLTLEAITTNSLIIPFIMTYASIFFSASTVNIWNSLPNSVVDASTINAFKARLTVKYDFTAVLTDTGNRPEEVTKW